MPQGHTQPILGARVQGGLPPHGWVVRAHLLQSGCSGHAAQHHVERRARAGDREEHPNREGSRPLRVREPPVQEDSAPIRHQTGSRMRSVAECLPCEGRSVANDEPTSHHNRPGTRLQQTLPYAVWGICPNPRNPRQLDDAPHRRSDRPAPNRKFTSRVLLP
jgi:hypothetical protein